VHEARLSGLRGKSRSSQAQILNHPEMGGLMSRDKGISLNYGVWYHNIKASLIVIMKNMRKEGLSIDNKDLKSWEGELSLPQVQEDTGQVLSEEMSARKGNEYIIEQLQRLSKENTNVANFISKMAADSNDPQAVAECGVLVYRLLEEQSELNAKNNKQHSNN
jgi:hypothetical protein